ncbi:hypothetical protein DSO57_1030052 [Entomophthora muscae]|uniref:Uncharacterized protein n=1 Tax=Entomophthora muscae TaxID=34485 RepID=A0ACC2ULW2_9FUNG|nr:hypothetical protein DSO57_1030052 [Entomophthora muscae]
MMDQVFADSQQLDQVPSRFKAVQVADSRRVAITHEMVPFSVRMGNVQVKLSGPIMAGLSHNVTASLDWLWINCPYIDWDTSVITLNQNGVGFQIYPVEMSKLLHNTVFVRITETGSYNFKGGLDFNQCSVKVICVESLEAPPLTTSPPPALAAHLKEYKDVFRKTLDQCCVLRRSTDTQQGILTLGLDLY